MAAASASVYPHFSALHHLPTPVVASASGWYHHPAASHLPPPPPPCSSTSQPPSQPQPPCSSSASLSVAPQGAPYAGADGRYHHADPMMHPDGPASLAAVSAAAAYVLVSPTLLFYFDRLLLVFIRRAIKVKPQFSVVGLLL